MHARRRRASGLAALSLTTVGVVLVQAAEAPGTAKEPRPASHFRLVLQGVEGAGVVKGKILKDTITSREIAPRVVFSYRAGLKLTARVKALEPLKTRIEDTFTRTQADQRFLLKGDGAAFLGKVEAESTYAKKSGAVAGQGSLVSGVLQAPASPTTVLALPGLGEIKAVAGSPNATFSFATMSTIPISVNTTARTGGSSVAGAPYEDIVSPGQVLVWQIVGAHLATITISATDGTPQVLSAQGLIGP